jgi:hypothetical protein
MTQRQQRNQKPNKQNETIQIFRTLQKRITHKIGASITSGGGRIQTQRFVADRPVQGCVKVRRNLSQKTLLTIPTRFDYSTTLMNITDLINHLAEKAAQGNWIPACGGTEQPFTSRSGRRLLYCWQQSTGRHAYLDCGSDLILSDEEARNALAIF